MTSIVHFSPRTKHNARKNVEDFVYLCRHELTNLGDQLRWDDPSWDVTGHIRIKGKNSKISISWANHDASVRGVKAAQMAAPFIEFARAFMRYQLGVKATSAFAYKLNALRALERSLSSEKAAPHIELANAYIFDRALHLANEKYSGSTPSKVGKELQDIADFINEKGMVSEPFIWKSFVNYRHIHNRIGPDFDANRLKKLPHPEAITALARAFHIATSPRDVVLSSIGALLACAPSRINEIFRMPEDCEIIQESVDGTTTYGIRWWPSKGAEPFIKWIGPTMVDVAKEAIKRIRHETEHARRVARWYTDNPDRMWLPPQFEYLRDEPLSLLCDFLPPLGLANIDSLHVWIKRNKITTRVINGRAHVRFADVERAILRYLPNGFPICDPDTGLRYCDALFTVPLNFYHSTRGQISCMIGMTNHSHVATGLGARIEDGASSLFSRLNFVYSDGNPIRINTHQFRHWLNTIAQRGGLSQLDIAKWSGRKNVNQNSTYDHVSASEMLSIVRENTTSTRIIGPIGEELVNSPISREDLLNLKFQTAHVTELGFCIHDFTMTPCQKHRDCINCSEHICVKGDARKTNRLREALEFTHVQIMRAEAALEEGSSGLIDGLSTTDLRQRGYKAC